MKRCSSRWSPRSDRTAAYTPQNGPGETVNNMVKSLAIAAYANVRAVRLRTPTSLR